MRPLRFAVIGDPIAHSRSPAMHRAAFAALGLPHTFEALRVTSGELAGVVQALREGAFEGLSVTIPHKRAVLALCDRIEPGAARAGAANTLARDPGGGVVALNTDAPALEQELAVLAGPDAPWATRRHLVLGAGGAARAAVAALEALGARDVAVRARAQARAGELPGAGRSLDPWAAAPFLEARTLAVVQATSAGMTGADPGQTVAAVVAWDALPPDAVVLDVVYAPAETPVLAAARARGLRTAGGLGMLARQGALALERWLGVLAPLDAMRDALGQARGGG